MNIYRPIGMGGVDGSSFADQLLYLEEIGCQSVDVRINSPGGNVLDGFSIFSAIRNCNMRGNCLVNTYVDYLAASISGVIALSGKERFIASNGLFMMHNVSGPDSTDKEKQIIQTIKESIIPVFATITGNTEDSISKLMDEETWVTANKAVKMKFFHSTFPALVPSNTHTNISAIELYEYSNSILTTNKASKMENEKEIVDLKVKVQDFENKLSASSAENKKLVDEKAELETKNVEMAEKITALQEKLAEKENLLVEKEKAEKARLEKDVEAFVEELANKGVIDKKKKEDNVKLALKDFEGYKNVFSSVKTGPARLSNFAGSGEGEEVDERAKWTHRDWEKNDPTGLENMYKNDPEKAHQLYNAYYLNK
jgi:ATP-dependent protease ClpP protease subunit